MKQLIRYAAVAIVLNILTIVTIYPSFYFWRFAGLLLPLAVMIPLAIVTYKLERLLTKLDVKSTYEIKCGLAEVQPDPQVLHQQRQSWPGILALCAISVPLIVLILLFLSALPFM